MEDKKITFMNSDDPQIEVRAFCEVSSSIETFGFLKSNIDYIRSRGAENSVIALKSGKEFKIKLPYKDLQAKLESGEAVIDLKDHCEKDVVFKAGGFFAGYGVYIGKWKPVEGARSLGKVFNVFAAPDDLGAPSTYENFVTELSQLKNWHGFDGESFQNETSLIKALKNGEYNGGWVIPTLDLLAGVDATSNKLSNDNLCNLQNSGVLAGTFRKSAGSYRDYYWSCTQKSDDFYIVDFANTSKATVGKNQYNMSCRPVRLVEIKP